MSAQRPPKRGEVYMHTPTGRRVVVLSDNRFNADPHTGRVLVAPLGRRPAPVSVPCGDQDPVGGFVHIAELGQASLGSLADSACMLSGHTLDRINRALVTLFDLPY
ncbi:type II toxin-antitoxin system PemK/MazF family toxin [Glycomyces sp. TRM65418]|uniref:type II toxin-antitoxin system PemK/MazF family toxin n=1 Tax=Glycomyces sp. TRM65418 TaxID=2867006 RepID=UPI001CE62067|nr:type II toxin-antitoxin system PemK/MazF family toxin [Glycomyces sp. TRM65418]MCC3765486.1 type II toxin-antitoxin system PemK/MazF family toxin [Glycomyces sp. TRM65418]QZD55094.1 type II toxin-antitoxin system PemK/MazF family toxin [Glycomyces sp. TRM65418]